MITTILLSSVIAYKPAYNLICDSDYTQFDVLTRTTKEYVLNSKYTDGRRVKLYVKDIFKPNKAIDYLEVTVDNKTTRYYMTCKIKE